MTKDERWKTLKVGDLIRIVQIPSIFSDPQFQNGDWEETFALYRNLINTKEVLTVHELDEYGRPWISFDGIEEDGVPTSHSLSMDDDSWEYV